MSPVSQQRENERERVGSCSIERDTAEEGSKRNVFGS
jgi:hypothetical protein